MKKVVNAILAVSLITATGLIATPDVFARQKPVKVEGKRALPLRVLARPMSKIYAGPEDDAKVIEDRVETFQSFYVYSKPSELQDFYQIGSDNRGSVLGWMRAEDVFEWKQTMCLSYTHPEGREPVLMFDKLQNVEAVTTGTKKTRQEAANSLYSKLYSGAFGPNFPVVSVEPKLAVDFAESFYLLPILDYQNTEVDGREARFIKLAAATASGDASRESSDIRDNKDYLTEAQTTTGEAGVQTTADYAVDIVWVMDTTISMRPYIQQTLEVVTDATKKLAESESADNMRFGIWGYRDSTSIQGIGYNTFNYTPKPQNIDEFQRSLSEVRVTEIDSVDFAEDMFSGVADALQNTQWTPNAMRVVVVVSDAPAHELGHQWNASGLSAEQLRQLASDQKTTVLSLHVKTPKSRKYHDLTEEQLKELSTNPGTNGLAAYFPIDSEEKGQFLGATRMIVSTIASLNADVAKIAKINQHASNERALVLEDSEKLFTLPSINFADTETEVADVQPVTEEEKAQEVLNTALKAAVVNWVGSESKAQSPRDIVAWVLDKDLKNPDIQSLEVRVLVNKRQLDSLKVTLSSIIEAGRYGQISGDDFFESLQATSAAVSRDPDMVRNAMSFAASGMVPEFLVGLPYHSRIMDMTDDLWARWSIDEQDEFLSGLDARIRAYEAIHDNVDGWIQLNPAADPDEHVYPISLDLLP